MHLYKLSRVQALDFLLQAGWLGGETFEAWPDFNNDPLGKAPWRCSGGHLQLYTRYLQWSREVSLQEKIIVYPVIIARWLQAPKDHIAGHVHEEDAPAAERSLLLAFEDRSLVQVPSGLPTAQGLEASIGPCSCSTSRPRPAGTTTH